VGTFAGHTLAFEGAEFTASHVRVLDVTHPERIVKIGEFRMRPVTSVHNMLLVGKRLYVAWYMEGVRVLDVSNPTRPRQVAHFHTFQEDHPDATDIIFQGTYGIRVPRFAAAYMEAMLGHPWMKEWIEAAQEEPWVIEHYEVNA